MLSKKNYKERLRKMEAKKERFSIRKFSVGAASVLIGFFLAGIGTQSAHAATVDTAATEKVASTNANSDATKSAAPASSAASSAATEKASSAASSATSSVASSAASQSVASSSASENTSSASDVKSSEATSNASSAVSEAAKSVASESTSSAAKSEVATSNASSANSDAKSSSAESSEVKSLAANGAKVGKNAQGTYAMLAATAENEKGYVNSQDVQDWAGFISALNDANVDHINITKDITVTGKVNGTSVTQPTLYGGRQKLDGKDIAREVTISGNNNTIDFTNQALDLTDANQGDTHSAWNITFEDVTIKADKLKASSLQTDIGSYSPISLTKVSAANQAKDIITFKNVTAEVNGRSIITGMTTNSAGAANTGYEKYTLVLKGNNNLTDTPWESGATPGDNGDAISAGYIVVEDGTTTINMKSTSSYNLQYGGAAVRANADYVKDSETGAFTKYPVDVKQGATLNITGGKDVKGIVSIGTSAVSTDLVGGAVNIDGNVNMDMGEGHSIAVYSGNLVVGKTGNLDITTKMTSQNSILGVGSIANYDSPAWGVLSIGIGKAGAAAIVGHEADAVLDDSGVIKVVRTSTDKGYNPIISMGGGSSNGNNVKTINVNEGATLDLQDNTMQVGSGMIFINGWIGGPSGSNLEGYINFNNPKYVNLQRLNQTLPANGGAFIFNERQKQNNAIYTTPVAQWESGNTTENPDYTWMITSSNSRGTVSTQAGDGFAPVNFDPSKVIIAKASPTYLTSNGTVVMATTQGAGQYNGSQLANQNSNQGQVIGNKYPYLNQFLNNFSWWTPQRIAMGSDLLATDSPVKSKDSDLYEPEVQTIDGTTNQTLDDLNPKDGIKDIVKSTIGKDKDGKDAIVGTPVDYDDVVSSTTWYTPSDASEWKKVMGDDAEPTNPTGDLKTTDKSAWAKVTYKDGTVDFVNIPLNITDPDNEVYTPAYPDTKLTQGKETTIPVNYGKDKDGKDITAPEGTTYKVGDDFKAPEGATVTVDPNTGAITVKAGDNTPTGEIDVPVTVTYPDKTTDTATAKVTVDPSDANEYNPTYNPVSVNQGGTVETGVPTYTNKDGKTATAPEGTKYEIPEGTKLPEGVTAKVDPSTGNVTVTTSSNTPEGPVFVPVKVTYPDGSTETIDAPIAVGPNTFIGTNYSFMVTGSLKNLHETTQNSMYVDPAKTITKIVWWNNKDLVNSELTGKGAVQHEITDFTGMTAEWINPLNTNVDTASLEQVVNSPKIKLTFGDNSQLIKETGTNLFATSDHSMSISWDTNMEGAAPVADAASKKLEVTPAKAGEALTDAEKALINTTNLDKLTANKPVSYTWANDLKAGDTQGTVRITFQDKDKNGQPTYLDVELPSGSLDVVNPKTDADKYTPEGQDVHTNVGGTPEASEGIANIPSLPSGTKYTWKDGEPDTKTPGTKPATVVVTYPDGSKDEVPVKVIVTANPTDADKYTPEGQDVHTNVGGTPEASEGIANIPSLPSGTKYTWKDGEPDTKTPGTKPATVVVTYPDGSKDEVPVKVIVDTPSTHYSENATGTPIVTEKGVMPNPSAGIGNKDELDPKTTYTWTNGEPDVNKIGKTTVSITVHYPDGKTQVVDTPLIVTGTEKPGDPGITNPDDPAYSDLFKTVTRTIVTDTKNADGITTEGPNVQKVVFGRSKTVDKDGNTTYSAYTIYNTTTNKLTNDKTGTFTKVDVPQHEGYVSQVNGKDAKEVPEQTGVTAETPNSTVTITYVKAGSDAAKYTPEGQPVNTKQGVVPDASEGIKNKTDLPEGTKYTWKDTPDVTTSGSHPAVVVVTYPDGSQDEVPVTVNVPAPEGQPVNTNVGDTPSASEGIKNPDDMPNGTKYSWKNGEPDTKTPGTKDAVVVVTYPDGKTEEVPVKVVVTDNTPSTPVTPTPSTPTNADQYTPEGQDVPTVIGTVPNAADGIKNKSDLPGGTTYTWKDTPDVNTAGSHDATIIVTYPDGSQDEVPVKVVVTSPEGQDIHTPTGVVPDASEGIKNKDDMPSGTTYTWKDTPDVTTPGNHPAVVIVTLPNGKTVEVPVTVVVSNPTPEGQDIHTPQGVLPNPSEGIKNKDDMPSGTKYEWEKKPDVKTPGKHEGTIRVTFPNGETVDVPVTVVVAPKSDRDDIAGVHSGNGDNGNGRGNGNGSESVTGVKGTHENISGNGNGNGSNTNARVKANANGDYVDAHTKTLPQTGAASNSVAAMLGVMIASVGAILGLAVEKKRRN